MDADLSHHVSVLGVLETSEKNILALDLGFVMFPWVPICIINAYFPDVIIFIFY